MSDLQSPITFTDGVVDDVTAARWRVVFIGLVVSFCLFTSALALPTPTPTPSQVIMATGTVRFYWSPPEVKLGVPAPTSYDFLELTGTTWKLLKNVPASTLYYDVANIGASSRVFGVQARVGTCPTCTGVIHPIGIPGIVTGPKAYMEIGIK